MAPDLAIRDTEAAMAKKEEEENYIEGQHEREDEEEDDEEDEAPSHLPFAPSSELLPRDILMRNPELCDTSTTIDPSYIISLIRQLLPRDVEKQHRIEDDNGKKETMLGAPEDPTSHRNLTAGSPSSNMVNGAHREYGEQERTGVSDDGQTEVSKTNDPWEDSGCVLWDLSANKTHAEFMVNNLLLDVLVANLQISESLRVTEICLGIIGNLACHDFLNSAIVSTNGLIEAVVQQLFLDDSTCLSEVFRLLSAGLQGNRFSSWTEALISDQVLLRILWIFGNTLNSALLEKSIDFLSTIINNHEVSSILVQPLVKLGLPNLVTSLLAGEMSKLGDENKLERSSVLDQVLGLVEVISSNDNYSQMIISNEDLDPLVCGVIKLPDKIEVASSCVSAIVIIANLLLDEQHLTLKLSQDLSFLQGLFDILPFLSDDLQARNAFWCIVARLLGQVQENGIDISTLQQFASLFVHKSHLIEEDIENNSMVDFGERPNTRTCIAVVTSLRKIGCILEKWINEKSAVLVKGMNGDSDDESDKRLQKLLHCCHKYV